MPADPKPAKKAKAMPVPDWIFKNPPARCRACGEKMWWWKNPVTTRWVPVNADSTSHYATCTDPRRFSGKGKVNEDQRNSDEA
jgi:hypothetical protein